MAATEVFANNPSTTVISGGTDAPVSGTTESWTVASATGWPSASTGTTQFHVGDPAAPSEIILVTNMSGTSWSVTRGAESTTPVAHAAGFTIAQVVTAGWLGSVAFVNPMTSPGDMVAGTVSGAGIRVPGNTSSTKQFLTQTGAAGTAQAPVWGTIGTSDVPTLNQNTTGTSANVSGTVATIHGGTGLSSLTAYAVVTGGTSSTASLQQVSGLGTSGYVLTSGGTGTLPSWQPASGSATLPADWINVKNPAYGATGNAVNSYSSTGTADGAVTATSHTFTSASLVPFTGSRSIWVPGAGSAGAMLVTTITCSVAGTGTLAVAASTTVSGALATWGTDDTAAIQAAISAAQENQATANPTGMTVYFPAGIYLVSEPLVVPPCITLLGSGQSLAYYAGSITQQLSGPILKPTSGFTAGTVSSQLTSGVITFLGQSLGGYPGGSSNQVIRNMTIDGRLLSPAGTIRGIEAWGPVWGVKIQDAGIFGMSDYGIYTSATTHGSDTTHAPDLWQITGTHIAACHNDGVNTTSLSDSYIVASESTGNSGNGWTFTGADNLKIVGCKAEYNTGTGLSIGRGGASRPILVNGFGTDGNYQYGIAVTGNGYGPVNLTGCGLNFDGQNNGAGGGTFAALNVTGSGHVTATGLQITSGTAASGGTFPTNGVYCPSTFAGVLQLGNCEIYAGGTPISVASSATGTVLTGTNVLTGTGNWPGESVTQVWEPVTAPGGALGTWQPSNHNLAAWTLDPALCTSQTVATAGTQYLSGLYVSQFTTFSNIYWSVGTPAGTATANQNFIGLVNSGGHIVSATTAGAIDSAITSTGLKTTALAGTVTPGFYWVVMLFNYTGAALQVGRGANFITAVPNVGLTAATYRYATCGVSQTSLGNFPITTASNALSAVAWWAAIG